MSRRETAKSSRSGSRPNKARTSSSGSSRRSTSATGKAGAKRATTKAKAGGRKPAGAGNTKKESAKAGTPKRSTAKTPRRAGSVQDGIRLQKFLADAGLGSRRQCEELITEGRVEIDRQVVTELGTRVRPGEQEVRLDGEVLKTRRHVYYLLNKPTGVVCTNSDPEGRMRAVDLIPTHERLFTVGRLDRSSEGLLLVTNDGDLANQLTHPSFEVSKLYRVKVQGQPTSECLQQLREGIHLAEGFAKVDDVKIKRRHGKFTELEMEIHEGRNREIRRILAKTGHKVLTLKRIAMGPLRLGELASGAFRPLERRELSELKRLVRPGRKTAKKTTSKKVATKKSSRAHSASKHTGARTGAKSSDKPARRKKTQRPAPRQGSVLVLEGDGAKTSRPKPAGKSKTASRKKPATARRSGKPATRKKTRQGKSGR